MSRPLRFETLVEADALRELLDGAAADLAIVDCRFDLLKPDAGRQAYAAGHIPGARYADLNRDLSAPVTAKSGRHPLPDPAEFAATLARLGVRKGVQVIAYDGAGGAFAARLWWMLRAWGHALVAVLDGGYPAWTAAGGATTAGEEPQGGQPAAAGSSMPPPLAQWPVVSTADVAKLLHDPRQLLVDARAPERFCGAVEPIDAVAGHVPGAENHPFSLNLGADGRFLPPPELRRRWESRLGSRDAAQVVAMCGSGVTACHNLLGLAVAGFTGAKLYAGSWSEWIRDPHRPIVGPANREGQSQGGEIARSLSE
jgi:thiosulfate/3-mercaptopyruvate sulfurtransferase